MIHSRVSRAGGTRGRSALGLLLGAACLVALSAGPAAAQDIRSQVQRLQQELKTLQQHVYGKAAGGVSTSGTAGAASGGANTPLVARLGLRMDQLEAQMRSLTGELEQVGWKIDQANRKLEQMSQGFEARLQALEQRQTAAADPYPAAGAEAPGQTTTGGGTTTLTMPAAQGGTQLAPGEAGPQVLGSVSNTNLQQLRDRAVQQPTGATAAQNTARDAAQAPLATQTATAQTTGAQTAGAAGGFASPRAQYDQAFNLLSQANYPAAEQALAAFIAAHPQDPLAGNAKYWLGETHYVRGQYTEAAVTFAEGYQTYPNSQKAPDILLKLGKSLAALGQTSDACGTFAELTRRYPEAPGNVLQQAQREQQRLSCP